MKLNETCCSYNGVPEECMGLCRSHRNRRSLLNELPVHRCDEHLRKIHSCVFEGIMKLHSNTLISLKAVRYFERHKLGVTYTNNILQTRASDKTVLVKGDVSRTQKILQKDTPVYVITAIQETSVKLVGRMKYFD